MKTFIINSVISIITSVFIGVIFLMIILRFYSDKIFIVSNDLSTMYQVIITILTILLGLSSLVTFYYSKISAENAMYGVVKSEIKTTVEKVFKEDKSIIDLAKDHKIIDLQKQINDILSDIEKLKNETEND